MGPVLVQMWRGVGHLAAKVDGSPGHDVIDEWAVEARALEHLKHHSNAWIQRIGRLLGGHPALCRVALRGVQYDCFRKAQVRPGGTCLHVFARASAADDAGSAACNATSSGADVAGVHR